MPSSSWVISMRTGQSRPATGFDWRNWTPSGGLPNRIRVERLIGSLASSPSLVWSISSKKRMPLVAMSPFSRTMVSSKP